MPHDECDRGSAELIDGTLCSGRGPGIRAAVRSARAAAAPLLSASRDERRRSGRLLPGNVSTAAPRPRNLCYRRKSAALGLRHCTLGVFDTAALLATPARAAR